MTSFVDTFAEAGIDNQINGAATGHDTREDGGFTFQPLSDLNDSFGRKIKRGERGGAITMEYMSRFRDLLRSPETPFHDYFLAIVRGIHIDEDARLDIELSVLNSGDEQHRLCKDVRAITLDFRYPSNRRYYIALTHDAFLSHLCGWVGSLMDCNLLQSVFLDLDY